jgi:hypothetical protein
VALALRSPFDANLLRAGGAPYVLDGAQVRNHFELHLVNKHPFATTFTIRASGEGAIHAVIPQAEIRLETLGSFRTPIVLWAERGAASPALVALEVLDLATGEVARLDARFLTPPQPNG